MCALGRQMQGVSYQGQLAHVCANTVLIICNVVCMAHPWAGSNKELAISYQGGMCVLIICHVVCMAHPWAGRYKESAISHPRSHPRSRQPGYECVDIVVVALVPNSSEHNARPHFLSGC